MVSDAPFFTHGSVLSPFCKHFMNSQLVALRRFCALQISLIIKTSGQSSLTKGRIAAAHERLYRIRQEAPMCMSLSCNSISFGTVELRESLCMITLNLVKIRPTVT